MTGGELVEVWALAKRRDSVDARLWAAVSRALDGGASPSEVAWVCGVSRETMYRELKRKVPDRRGDGRARWWTDGVRFYRGVPPA